MSDYVTGFHTKDGVKKYDYRALANLPESGTDITNTVISPNADYAEVGEWADGNPDKENRLGYFVAIAEVGDNTIKIRKATSTDDVRGVSVYNPAFSGNASKNKYDADGELLPQYNYIGVMGIVSVIDNGRCTVGGRCMPSDDGTAIPSGNNMGYAVLERVDNKHVLIAVEPGADMIQRVKADVKAIEEQLKEGGGKGDDGATFTPYVSDDGVISWTNNKNLQNPASVNIKGVGISKIEKGPTSGLVDTYTITLTNGNTFDFTVTNGQREVRGIKNAEINASGELVITYTDGTPQNLGKVVGEGGGGSGTVTINEIEADKVYFEGELVTTYTMGNIKSLSNGTYTLVKEGEKKSLRELWNEIYVGKKDPSRTAPSCSISVSGGYKEVGEQYTYPTAVLTANTGSYGYGSVDKNGVKYSAAEGTGIVFSANDVTLNVGSESKSNDSAMKTGDTLKLQAKGSNNIYVDGDTKYEFTATATYTESDRVPINNLGEKQEKLRYGYDTEGDKTTIAVTSQTATFTGYRKTFYGVLNDKVDLTDDNIRGICEKLTASSTSLGNGSEFTIEIPASTTAKPIYRVLIAYPATLRDLTRVEDKNDANTDIKSGFKLVKKSDKSMLNIAGANDYLPIAYKVWIMDYSNPYDTANEYKVTI